MTQKEQESKPKKVDTRVVSLFSNGIDNVRNGGSEPDGLSHGQMFSHYDEICVKGEIITLEREKERFDRGPLYQAYQIEDRAGARERLIAFTDIVEKTSATEYGYTEEEINDFWNDDSEPLLFVTMLNLDVDISGNSSTEQFYTDVLKKINTNFGKRFDDSSVCTTKYLVYFTFDFCNIVIFCKGHSFRKYSYKLFCLDYQQGGEKKPQIVDSITVYGFLKAPNELKKNKWVKESTETFDVYLKFGVTDVPGSKNYFQQLKAIDTTLSVLPKCILGRHDVGFLCQKVNLRWLVSALDLRESDKSWYNLFTLQVLAAPKEEGGAGAAEMTCLASPKVENEDLKTLLLEECDGFLKAYRAAYEKRSIPKNAVWERWITESTQLVAFFATNKMTFDMGVCLAAQFLDFFRYGKKIYSKPEDLSVKMWEEAEECINHFFTNTSILLDSMDHHLRQFVTAPSFRTPAFEMPPKIMAYYAIAICKLISVFRGAKSKDKWCSFMLCPEFTKTLQVRSLMQEAEALFERDNYQYISIGIDEREMYRMQCTTAILAHEISHFLGEKTRCRPERKQHILVAEITNLIGELWTQFFEQIQDAYQIDGEVPMNWRSFQQLAENLLKILKEADEESFGDKLNLYRNQVEGILQNLPRKINNNRTAKKYLFDSYMVQINNIKDRQGSNPILVKEMELAGVSDNKIKKDDLTNWKLIEPALFQMFERALFGYAEKYGTASGDDAKPGKGPRWFQICENFNEAYADLNAILLFDLSFNKYLEMFHEEQIAENRDKYNRFLPIVDTLIRQGIWKKEDLPNSRLMELWEKLQAAWKDREGADEVETALRETENLDTAAIKQLSAYLKVCLEKIKEQIDGESKKAAEEIRQIYKNLDSEHGSLAVISNLSKEISAYYSKMMEEGRGASPKTFIQKS